MELQTISQVSKLYGISTRMLRYYEQIGLIRSLKKEDYSYRVYDEDALKRLQRIIILRKLQIPVRQICVILNNPDAATVLDIFEKNVTELDHEIAALSTIKLVLTHFISELREITAFRLNPDIFDDDSVLKLTESLSLVQKNVKEILTMKDLNKADRQLSKLQDVRLMYLPPMTVASSHYIGENPEYNAGKALDDFVKATGLYKTKPDLRHIGFDNPTNPYGDANGYEMWVSIPEDMDVPAPLVKKKFLGGQYAAHAAEISSLDHWLALQEWVNDSDKYESDAYSVRCAPHTEGLNGYLEEQLNYYHNVQNPDCDGSTVQLDLLLPVKPAESAEEASFEIEGSEEKCGYKARLIRESKFRIMGFSTYISFELQSEELKAKATQEFWKALKADGRLDALIQHKKPGAPILMFGSYDHECKQHGGWRQTVCLRDSDMTDVKAFKAYNPFIKKLDASKWICFEITKETTGLNPHAAAPQLGYTFNGPISGVLTVYPEGITGILDQGDKADRESVIYCWFPIK
jgi:DNA-binding transcriptional MerR regulator/DNA gyrase inhibitor GyrI